MPRRCTVCENSDLTKINKAICNNLSYRKIAEQFNVSGSAVYRHIETCLRLELAVIKNGHRTNQVIDVHAEFEEQLAFAKDLREAAKKWLVVADEIDLDPRENEVHVIYTDRNSGIEGLLVKKKAPLSEILNRINDEGYSAQQTIIKTVDLRKFALDAINTADLCIDKFAKLFGLYQNPRLNEKDMDSAVETYLGLLEWFPERDPEYHISMLTSVPGIDEIKLRAAIAARAVQTIEAVQ